MTKAKVRWGRSTVAEGRFSVSWRLEFGGLRLVRRSRRYVKFVSATDEVFVGSTEPKAAFKFGGLRLRRAAGAAK